MRHSIVSILTLLLLYGCASSPSTVSDKVVGGPCEGCEAIFESPIPFDLLSNKDTLEDFIPDGPRIHVTGTVYQQDGVSPAKDVVLYIYHTDQHGIYPKKGNEKGWALRHGYLRGWIKTMADGHYDFWTLRPAPYPERNTPAHIHATIKEPGKTAYYIDEYLFDNDPLLSKAEGIEGRGGSGIVTVDTLNGSTQVKRNIFLGRNIPGYPDAPSR